MNHFDKLHELFMKFPGVGRRQAKRFVYHLLEQPQHTRDELGKAIQELGENIKQCEASFQYFQTDTSTETFSPIERDESRDKTRLMVVAKDADLEAVEKSNVYNGTYFILGGLVPATSNDTSHLRVDELKQHIKNRIKEYNLSEVILALSFTPESEYTRNYIEGELQQIKAENNLTISQLGRGLSTGSELEYADPDTLGAALESRS